MTKKRIFMGNIVNKNINDTFKDYIKYCRITNLVDAMSTYYEDCW